MTTVELTDSQLVERGETYLRGEQRAEAAALRWQQIADALADMLDETMTATLTPWVPTITSLTEWYGSTWPDGGTDIDTVRHHLRGALAAAHAYAGAYSRAAGAMGEAILAHRFDLEQRGSDASAPQPAPADECAPR